MMSPDVKTSPRILILGASGMLGFALLRIFCSDRKLQTVGTVRNRLALDLLPYDLHKNVVEGVDVTNSQSLAQLFSKLQPNVVVNCIGVTPHTARHSGPLEAVQINALLPHRLARLCTATGAYLVHISTDAVFPGTTGLRSESDMPSPNGVYGFTKYLGEVCSETAITIRTSIIGNELNGSKNLVGWLLAQNGKIKGYSRVIFSGLPAPELARVIRDHVIPNKLPGLYHISAEPISKFELLKLVAKQYGKNIEIESDESVVLDRSLDSTRFRRETNYCPPCWTALISNMYHFYKQNFITP